MNREQKEIVDLTQGYDVTELVWMSSTSLEEMSQEDYLDLSIYYQDTAIYTVYKLGIELNKICRTILKWLTTLVEVVKSLLKRYVQYLENILIDRRKIKLLSKQFKKKEKL
ncbi:MAG: hypothetical protein ACK5L6_07485 [Anaerorhabdus sp.]|uniref:hypothetical protein n=1 Tax=Anaerorhabdus sp. TaxID=1872524 RepID=UPI003A85E050